MASIFLKFQSLLTSPQRKAAMTLTGLMIIGMVLEMLGVGLIIPALVLMSQQDLTMHHPWLRLVIQKLDAPTQVQLVQIVMIGLAGIYLIKNVFLVFLVWTQNSFAYGVQEKLSQRLFTAYLRQPYTFHLQRNSAQLIRNVTTEVGMFAQAIVSAMMILTESLVLIGISTLLLLIEPRGAAIVTLILGGAALISYRTTRRRIVGWGAARLLHDGMRLKHLQQGLGGAKDVKLLGRESDFLERYGYHNARSARVARLQGTVQMLPRLWLELLAVVGLATLVLSMLESGRDMTSLVPTLGLFAAAAFRLMPSVNRILAGTQVLQYNSPVINNLYDELGIVETESLSQGVREKATERFKFENALCAVDISYTYPNASECALEAITVRIAKGESIGLVGPSGSGKSTLADVVLGLLPPTGGQVIADGLDIQTNLRGWQDQIGYVPQTVYLTDDTLRRNVAFGIPNDQIDETAVWTALRAAQLEEFVTRLPAGLETVVGERGIRLSGGQRQRIGIARALYHDPEVLVLDEATSSLDTATERGVMQAVMALRGSKTILIVAHRLSTVENCDRLYRLEQGRVVVEGTPETVLRVQRAV